MFLLTTNVVKSSHIEARIFFIFPETVLNQTKNAFNIKFSRQTISYRIPDTKFSFGMKEHNTGKV